MEFRSLAGAAGCAAAFGVAVLVAPGAQADPQFNAAEKQYLGELYLYVHPSVTPPRLVELGHLACAARRDGATSDQAREVVWRNLDAAGVVSSNAEMGTLVHVAVDNLCPEVGYP
ncbi:hypothetical protein CRI77_10405 [Mycolicibacterium duvalii]|uniref:Uncharacterized protein n=1 Tax=Mycolicibacterium duvalii TaxID=39688 RepID=A0A7I7K101_9MYCO|nr:DUF732 domain-containing protein [Mycolicibacterium duvalii]MCV7366654.1 DUF732 domain-containing protein [Mycolicibacterium duvalii]PEG41563.1 hypothetical protein CRI77_10405 [Mycolicibacterium duvalii]BBX17733.1 hypothetical protein MDUV_25930 [Mycolicibacterium duvalii]